MRARLVYIVLALLVVGGVAAMNWPDFTRTTPMSFGVLTIEGSVGLFMLAAFGLTILVMLLSSAMQESRYMRESNRHAKALQVQRDLADKAEASRFTELRQYLDTHLRDNRGREAIAATEFEKAMVQSQRDLRSQLEQMSRSLDARLAELQGRIDARLDRVQPVVDVPPRPLDVQPRAADLPDLPPRERERL
jgi:small-conductance mechanosensitive channel